MFDATTIIKNNDKEKYVCSVLGTVFDGKGEWSFGYDYARNVVIFGFGNSSSSHIDNLKNDFLIFDEGDAFGINGGFGAPEKKFKY